MVKKTACRQPTNPLLIKEKHLITDWAELETVPTMYRAIDQQLPHSIQELLNMREGKYELRVQSVLVGWTEMDMMDAAGGRLNFLLLKITARG